MSQNQNKQQYHHYHQQQQQQQQQQWQHAHVASDTTNMNMFAGSFAGGGGGFNLEMGGRGPVGFDAFSHQHQQQQQQHHHQQHPLQQVMPPQNIKMEPLEHILTPTIEMDELIIKTEPPDEVGKVNLVADDSLSYVDYNNKRLHYPTMAQPPKVQHIKEELLLPSTSPQPKPLNFPRLKLQTERSDTLPICQRCKQVFFKKHSYTRHVAQSICEILEYDFKCCICPMSFMSSEELQSHEHLHRANKYFCHKYCGKSFDTIQLCEVHEHMQHDYVTFVCNVCSSSFPSRELLFSHMPLHQHQPRFDCPVCRLWFQTPHQLHQHRMEAIHFCGKYYVPGRAAVQAMNSRPAFPSATNMLPNQNRPNMSPMHQRSNMLPNHQQANMPPNHHQTNMSPNHHRASMPSNHHQRNMPPNHHRANMPPNQQPNYNLQDCHMGVIEVPTTSKYANFLHNRSYPPSNFQNTGSNFQLPHPIKTEFKVENDFFSTNDYQQQQQQQQQLLPQQSHNFNDYTNSPYAAAASSSHNSLPPLTAFTNDYTNNPHQANLFNLPSHHTTPAVDDTDDALCCVPKCGVRKSTSPTLQFFVFPKDDKYLSQWLHNLKINHQNPQSTNYATYRICSLHFPKRCINRHSLCYWAVPTFNLGHDDVANLYQNRELTNTFTSGEFACCSMPGCSNQRGESNLKFYNFPKDTKTLIRWCQNARLPVYSKEPRHFCGRHFEERCFGKFRLKPWAVPTLHLGTAYGKIHDNPGLIYLEEKKCCLTHCRRTRSSDFNLSLYRFPRDEVLLQRWCYNLRLDPAVYRGKNHKICSAHFVKEALGLRKLSPGAVPTLNLGHSDTFNIYENELYTPPPPPPPQVHHSSPKVYSFHNSTMSSMSYSGGIPSISPSPSEFATATSSTSSTSNGFDSIDVCFVQSCQRNRHIDNVTLHTIPRRPEQMQKWCHNLKLDINKLHKGVRICSAHFESYCIGGCMRPFAVPTLNLGHDDEDIHRNPDVIKKLNIRETCCVQQCKRNRDRDHANLHRFPSKPGLLEKWCENLQKPIPDGSRLFNDAICEVHFEDRCLRNKRLERWAVPTLLLGHTDGPKYELPSDQEIAEFWAKPAVPNTGDEEGDCCVETCKRNPQIDDIKLYRMPEDPLLLSKWSHNLQLEQAELANLRICNLHFESHCIGKRLHSWAIPTLNLAKNIENLYENPERTTLVVVKKEKIIKTFTPVKSWTPRCCLPHCRKMRSSDHVHLYRFPKINRSMLAKWCHNLQIPLVGNGQRRLCSSHFEPHVLTKRCPMPNSVPTIDLNTPPGYKIYQNPARLKLAKLRLEKRCIIPTCGKTRTDGVTLFRFPHNRSLLRKWGHNTQQKPTEALRAQYRVCSRHFEPHSFGTKRLCPGAIPTLNLCEDVVDVYPNEAQSFAELQCVVKDCHAVKETENVRLFKFPCDDEDLLWKWCNNLKMNPVDCPGVRICNRHFEVDCLAPKSLYKWAIPTVALGHDDAEIELIQNPKPEERYTEVVVKCCVPTCGKSRKYHDAQMNSFPKNPKMFRRWQHNLKLESLDFKERDKYKICNDHFEAACVGKMRLNYGAIPTVNLGHDNTSDLYKVNHEQLQISFFGRQSSLADKSIDKENEDDIEVDLCEIEAKCSYTDCKASKTLLREPYDLPKNTQLLELWCLHMKLSKDDTTLLPEPKLCGLHFLDCYRATLEDCKAIPDIDTDLQIMHNAHARCSSSLLIRSAQCSVQGCSSSQITQHRLYQFPYNRELIQKWSFNTGIEVDENRRYLNKVCSEHFETYCLTESQRLRSWAIPTLQLNHMEPEKVYQNPDLNSMERRMLGPVTFKCSVTGCARSKTDEELLRLFNFPTDESMLLKWTHNLKLEREKCPLYKICDEHFEPHCVGNSRLRSWAIPTLNLGHSDADINLCMEPNLDEDLPIAAHVKMKKSLDSIKCCVLTCRKSRLQHGVRLFGFPTALLMMKKWCHNLELPLSALKKQPRICNLHFHKRCIEGKQVRSWALPTMHLGHSKENIYENPRSVPGFFLPQCCLPHCKKLHPADNNLRTFGFPKDEELMMKWCLNLNLKPAECKGRICYRHFEDVAMGQRKLKSGAVPTLELGHSNDVVFNNEEIFKNHDTSASSLRDGSEHSFDKSESIDISDPSSYLAEDDIQDDNGDDDLKEEEEKASPSKLNISVKSSDPLSSTECLNEVEISPKKREKCVNNIYPICCLKHCRKEKTPEHHLKTFGFPKDRQLLQKWCDNLKLNIDDCIGRVCIEHFELCMVGARKLKPGAVPTINLGHNDKLKYTNKPNSANNCEEENETQPTATTTLENDNDLAASSQVDESPFATSCTEKLNNSVFRLCCLKHCRRKKTANQHLRTFGFPKETDLRQKWCDNLKVALEHCRFRRICEAHFEPEVIGKLKLHPGAVPTLDLGHGDANLMHKNSELTLNYVTVTNIACNVPNCTSTSRDEDIRIFRFPKKPKLVIKWCDNLKLQPHINMYTRYRICHLHFEPRAIGTRLCFWAIPTLNLGHSEGPKHLNPTTTAAFVTQRCCIESCRKSRKKHNIQLFSFPKPSQLLARKWCHNTKQSTRYTMRRICSEHFVKHSLLNGRPRPWAVPTLNLGHSDAIFDNPMRNVKEPAEDKCCIKNCENKENEKLFGFPKRGNMLRKWAHNTNQDAYLAQRQNYKVCRKHFEMDCFANDGETDDECLKSSAIPTLNLAEDVCDIYQLELAIGDEMELNTNCCVPHCGRSPKTHFVKLFPFPNEPEELTKWCHNLQLNAENCRHLFVCNLHFESGCVSKTKLLESCLPTMLLGHNDDQSVEIYQNPVSVPKPPMTPAVYCCVPECGKSKSCDSIRMNRFPKSRDVHLMWAHNLKLKLTSQVLKSYKVCDDHFESYCKGKKHLNFGAVPTLKLGHNDDNIYRNNLEDGKFSKKLGNESIPQALKCIVPNCSIAIQLRLPLYKLPEDDELLSKWCDHLKIDLSEGELPTSNVCALHFIDAYELASENITDDTLTKEYESIRKFPRIRAFQCAVSGCDSKYINSIKLYKVPSNSEISAKWRHNTKLEFDENRSYLYKVCALHFEQRCWANSRLHHWAVPTLRLNHNDANIYLNPEQNNDQTLKVNCCVKNCHLPNNNEEDTKHWNFPNDKDAYNKWCHNVGVNTETGNSLKICSNHFEPYCFGPHLLRSWAIPTLNLNNDNVTQDMYTNPERKVLAYACCISSCRQMADDDAGIILYRFPKNPTLYQKWTYNVRLDSETCQFAHVCTLHFEKQCIGKQILRWAIPTLDLGHNGKDIFKNPKIKSSQHLDKCCLPYCGKIGRLHNVRLFSFPLDEEMLDKWQENLNVSLENVKKLKICSAHFEPHYIRLGVLQAEAMPTLNLKRRPEHNSLDSNQMDTTQNMGEETIEEDNLSDDDESSINDSAISHNNTTTVASSLQKCSIATCQQTPETHGIQLFAYPRIDWLRQKWCENTQINESEASQLKICSVHFETLAMGKTKPRPWALPTLELGHNEKIHENPKQLPKYHPEEKMSGEIKFVRGNCCAIISCLKSKTDGVQLFKYPGKGMLLRKWAENCKHYAYQAARYSFRICDEHFEANCINGNRLRLGSIPTLKLGHSEENIHKSEWRQPAIETSTINLESDQQCSVPNCGRSKLVDQVKLYKFPENTEVLEKWCQNLKISQDESAESFICNMHFEERCIKLGRLLIRAIPTLLLGHQDTDIIENPESFDKPEVIVRCCLANCGKSKSEDQVMLSQFPKLKSLFEKWVHNLKLPASSEVMHTYKVCSDHFESYCYEHGRLKCGSMPTLKLGHDDTNIFHTKKVSLSNKYYRKRETANVNVATLSELVACCYPQCTEIAKNKTRQVYELPESEDLRLQWCQSMGLTTDQQSNSDQLKLCPIHFKITYDANLEELQRLQDEVLDDEMAASIKNLHSTYSIVMNATRVLSSVCSVPECRSNNLTGQTRLFQFPYNSELLEKWSHNTKIAFEEDRRSVLKVCSLHFEPYCCMESSKRRRNWAVPTLKLPQHGAGVIFLNPDPETMDRRSLNLPTHNNCCIPSCENSNLDGKATPTTPATAQFYSFPKDADLLKKWLHNTLLTSRESLNSRICSLHFEKYCINKRLRAWAVPTLMLGGLESAEIFQNPEEKIKLMENVIKDTEEAIIDPEDSVMDTEDIIMDTEDAEDEEFIESSSENELQIEQIELELKRTEAEGHATRDESISNNDDTQNGQKSTSRHCKIEGCWSHAADKGVTFHKFPVHDDLFNKWVHNTQIQADKSCPWRYRICSKHFETDIPMKGSRTFHPGTMPTLHLGPNRPETIYQNELFPVESQTTATASTTTLTTSPTFTTCAIPTCLRQKRDGVFLHIMPSNTILQRKWIYNCRLDPAEVQARTCFHTRICSRHFEEKCFKGVANNRTQIKFGSIPTLHLGHTDENIYECFTGSMGESTHEIVCSVKNCGRTNEFIHVRFFSFPKSKPVLAKWLHNLKMEYDALKPANYNICERHFAAGSFAGSQLRDSAVPTLHLGNDVKDVRNEEKPDGVKKRLPVVVVPDEKSLPKSCTTMGEIQYNEIKSGHGKCSLIHCQRELYNANPMFKFPKSVEHQEKWSHNLRIQYNPKRPWKYLICRNHFEDQCIKTKSKKKTRLQRWAMPTLNLGPNVPAILFTNENARMIIETKEQNEQSQLNAASEMNTQLEAAEEEPAEKRLRVSIDDNSNNIVNEDNSNSNASASTSTASKHSVKDSTRMRNRNLRCLLPHCRRNRYDGVKLFRVPQEPATVKIYENNLRMRFKPDKIKNLLICNMHFEAKLVGAAKLLKGAAPTLNLGHSGTNLIHSHQNTLKLPMAENRNETLESNAETATTSAVAQSASAHGCYVSGCKMKSARDRCRLYPLPEYINLAKRWLERTQISSDEQTHTEIRICNRHFEKKWFRKNGKLAAGAVPTKVLPPPPPPLPLCPPTSNEVTAIEEELPSTSSAITITTTSTPLAQECSVPLCTNADSMPAIKMFSTFPEDFELFTKWCFNLKIDPRKYIEGTYHVCSAHFEPFCIGGHSLRLWAVPTLKLGHSGENIHKVERPAEAEMKCCLPHCGRKHSIDGVSFFNFPKGDLYKSWCKILQIDEGLYRNADKRICSAHFTPNCITGSLLNVGAKPSLNMVVTRTNVVVPPNLHGTMEKPRTPTIYCPKCIVPGCSEIRNLYVFPQNRNLCIKWCHNVKIDYHINRHRNDSSKICQKHFDANCIYNGKLHREAVPTLHLGHKDLNIFQNTVAFATATFSVDNAAVSLVNTGPLMNSTAITDDMDIEDSSYYADFEKSQGLCIATDGSTVIELDDDDDDEDMKTVLIDDDDEGDDGDDDVLLLPLN